MKFQLCSVVDWASKSVLNQADKYAQCRQLLVECTLLWHHQVIPNTDSWQMQKDDLIFFPVLYSWPELRYLRQFFTCCVPFQTLNQQHKSFNSDNCRVLIIVIAKIRTRNYYFTRYVVLYNFFSRQSRSPPQTVHLLKLKPRAGFGVVRIDPFCFLAGCLTRRLNQV